MKRKDIYLFNVAFGILLFLPPGWIVILLVLIIESVIVSRILEKKWFDKILIKSVICANLVSGIVGVAATMNFNYGLWLVC